MMTIEQKVEQNIANIKQAIEDYWKHDADNVDIKNDITDTFIRRLAEDNAKSKEDLRNLFRKSEAWNEELDCLVINGNKTHDPDKELIESYFNELIKPAYYGDRINLYELRNLRDFFMNREEEIDPEHMDVIIQIMNKINPKAYAKGKKKSKILRALAEKLDLIDESKGSDWQIYFAKIADEMNSKQISFKLFVSVNPAHFLTMSNPKGDNRGATLTSCHSFNSVYYSYNNGCTGYAKDKVTLIVFTVSDPDDSESLNNRKTLRQLYFYKPGNGVLVQSRMYNTSGGTSGAQKDSKIFRDLIEREICECEDEINLWKVYDATGDKRYLIHKHPEFGGYEDWIYTYYAPKIAIRNSNSENPESLLVGAAGLCIHCGRETSRGLYCSHSCECAHDHVHRHDDEDHDGLVYCEGCGEWHNEEDGDWRTVDGEYQFVCLGCAEDLYFCEDCEEYHWNGENGSWVRGGDAWVCDSCLEDNYTYCDECNEYEPSDSVTYVESVDRYVCDYCLEEYYTRCDECGEYFRDSDIYEHADGNSYCENCLMEIREREEEESESEVA